MIKNKTVKVKMIGTNIGYYKKLGFEFKKMDEIDIPMDLMNKNSHYKIIAICDICGKENETSIKNYYCGSGKDVNEKYLCRKCSIIKANQTKLEKYGYENYTNREKAKETLLKKYGVDHVSKIPGHNEKVEKTMNRRYGSHFSKTEEFLDKFKKTVNKNFGVDYPMQSAEIRNKSKKTCLEKYGVSNISQTTDNFLKVKKSSLSTHRFRDTDLFYQGEFEGDFLEKFYDRIDIKKQIPLDIFFKIMNIFIFQIFI